MLRIRLEIIFEQFVGIRVHRPELPGFERSPAPADPFLGVERRSPRSQSNAKINRNQQREACDQRRGGNGDVKGSLGGRFEDVRSPVGDAQSRKRPDRIRVVPQADVETRRRQQDAVGNRLNLRFGVVGGFPSVRCRRTDQYPRGVFGNRTFGRPPDVIDRNAVLDEILACQPIIVGRQQHTNGAKASLRRLAQPMVQLRSGRRFRKDQDRNTPQREAGQ